MVSELVVNSGCSLCCEPELAARLLEDLPPGFGLDFDPAELIINTQPVESYLRLNTDRVLQFRARDAVRDFSQGRGIEVQLGRGSVDLPSLLGLLEEKRFNGYFLIEAAENEDPELSCSNALEYLRQLFA